MQALLNLEIAEQNRKGALLQWGAISALNLMEASGNWTYEESCNCVLAMI